jgi:nitrogen fixation/metabolism regulation signal transduction histidine kinase
MSPSGPGRRHRIRFEQRILLLALMTGLAGTAGALLLLWTGDFSPKVRWTFTLALGLWWLGYAFHLRTRVVTPLQTLSNLLAALREGDFSIRGRGAVRGDALGDVWIEVNSLADTLRGQRLDALEATSLLRKIMQEIDVAILAFDPEQRLKLVNRAGERLLDRPAEQLLERGAEELGLADCLEGEAERTEERSFPGGSGRWEIRRLQFRQEGLPLALVVIADLSRVLREEERQAWQRLIRVLGHELNNSLAPIRSVAGSLASALGRRPRPAEWEEDFREGLGIIASRADGLSRFMDAYARMARLPRPSIRPVELGPLIRRVAGLETRMPITIVPGADLTMSADSDQLEQLLINLLRNAVDAALETGGSVRVGWKRRGGHAEIWVEDEGPGLSNTSNLFVPFFTTKPGGSGIGLVLSRQIAEAHGGTLTVEDRRPGPGCSARLRLPCR